MCKKRLHPKKAVINACEGWRCMEREPAPQSKYYYMKAVWGDWITESVLKNTHMDVAGDTLT